MYIKINSSLFNEEIFFGKIDRIFYHFEDGKHTWVIDDDLDLEIILDSVWLNTHARRMQHTIAQFLERAFIDSNNITTTQKKERVYTNISKANRDNEISIDFAVKYLNEPLYILVENEISDSTFLNCLFRSFRKKGKKIRKALENDWIQYYNAGGKTMIINILKPKLEREPLPVRFFIFADSDKLSPDMIPLETQKLMTYCNEFNLPIHVLEKREIENYIPVNAFKIPIELQNVLDTYISLSNIQKDYYDLAEGFKHYDEKLFDNLQQSQINYLRKGFSLKEYSPKKELYLLFNEDSITRDSLIKITSHQSEPDELEKLLEKLTRLL